MNIFERLWWPFERMYLRRMKHKYFDTFNLDINAPDFDAELYILDHSLTFFYERKMRKLGSDLYSFKYVFLKIFKIGQQHKILVEVVHERLVFIKFFKKINSNEEFD